MPHKLMRTVLLLFISLWTTIPARGDVRRSAPGSCNATIEFGSLPSRNEFRSRTEYDAGGLAPYYKLPESFIETVRPGKLPYEVVKDIACSVRDCEEGSGTPTPTSSDDVITQSLSQLTTWLIPVFVVGGLGVVMAALFPCVGFLFCCYRHCGLCGAKAHKYRSKHQTVKCFVFTVIFLAADVMIITGVVFGFISNKKISDSIRGFDSTADTGLQDGINYLTDTADEVFFVVDELESVTDVVLCYVENIGATLGDPLQEAVSNEANPVFEEIEDVLCQLDLIYNETLAANETATDLISLGEQLNSEITLLRTAMTNLSAACGNCSMDPYACDLIPSPGTIDAEIDWNEAQDLTLSLDSLSSINTTELRGLVQDTNATIHNISNFLTDEADGLDINSTILEAESTLQNVTRDVESAIDDVTAADGILEEFRERVSDILGEDGIAGMYDTFRYAVAVLFLCLIVLIVVVFTLGIFCGVFGYSAKALPYERNSVSHRGAVMILIAVALCFLTSGLLLILTSLTFLLGTTIQKICTDLEPPDYAMFREVLDNPSLWGGHTLIGSIAEESDISLNLSVSDFLNDCEANPPLWQALKADSAIDLDSLLSNITELLDEFAPEDAVDLPIDLTSGDIIPAFNRATLESINNTVVNHINFTSFEQLIGGSILSFGLDELHSNLTLLASITEQNCTAVYHNETIMIFNETVMIIDDLERINTTLVTVMQDQVDSLEMIINRLQNKTQDIYPTVLQALDSIDTFANDSSDIVNDQINEFFERLQDLIQLYLNFTNDTIREEVGRCEVIPAVYKSVFISVCKEALDGLNGFWFSIGWCVLFFIPAIVSGVAVTSYFRRSPSDIHHISERESAKFRLSEIHSNPHVTGYDDMREGAHSYPGKQCLPHVPTNDW